MLATDGRLDKSPGLHDPGTDMDDPVIIMSHLAELAGRDPCPRAIFAEVGLGPPVITRPQPLVELFFVLRGSCYLEVGGRGAAMAPGHLALINAHQGNRARNCSRGFSYGCVSLHLDDPGMRSRSLLAVRRLPDLAGLIAAARAVADHTHAAPGPLAALIGKAALLRFLLLAHAGFSGGGSPSAGDSRLTRALAWINEHHRDPDLTVADLAHAAGLSAEHLGRLFHRAYKLSPMQYVLRLRLERARGLLAKTDLGVKEIASLVGFRDPGYFSRRVSRSTGSPPSRLRNDSPNRRSSAS